MELRAVVKFRDKGEAARWLARYYSPADVGLAAASRAALWAEFPHEAEGPNGAGIWSQVIEREALRVLGVAR